MIYLEKRFYPRDEIAQFFELRTEDNHFAKKVRDKLQNLGFKEDQYTYSRKGVSIEWTPQTTKEKIVYLVRLMGIDSRVDPLAFSSFVWNLMANPDFQCRPREEQVAYLKELYQIDVSSVTLSRWYGKLQKLDAIKKDTNTFSWWRSERFDGVIYRTELDPDCEELKDYRQFCAEYEGDRKNWFSAMWNKFGCKYYKCYQFDFGAWQRVESMRELLNLVELYMGGEDDGQNDM